MPQGRHTRSLEELNKSFGSEFGALLQTQICQAREILQQIDSLLDNMHVERAALKATNMTSLIKVDI